MIPAVELKIVSILYYRFEGEVPGGKKLVDGTFEVINPSYDLGGLNRQLLAQQLGKPAATPSPISTSDNIATESAEIVFTYDLAGEFLPGNENPGRASVPSEKPKPKLKTPEP